MNRSTASSRAFQDALGLTSRASRESGRASSPPSLGGGPGGRARGTATLPLSSTRKCRSIPTVAAWWMWAPREGSLRCSRRSAFRVRDLSALNPCRVHEPSYRRCSVIRWISMASRSPSDRPTEAPGVCGRRFVLPCSRSALARSRSFPAPSTSDHAMCSVVHARRVPDGAAPGTTTAQDRCSRLRARGAPRRRAGPGPR